MDLKRILLIVSSITVLVIGAVTLFYLFDTRQLTFFNFGLIDTTQTKSSLTIELKNLDSIYLYETKDKKIKLLKTSLKDNKPLDKKKLIRTINTSDYLFIIGNENKNILDARGIKSSMVYIFGRGGNDILLGTKNNDYIKGDNGNDYIVGCLGDDDLLGDDGDDVIYGDSVDEQSEETDLNEDLFGNCAYYKRERNPSSELSNSTVANDCKSLLEKKLIFTFDDRAWKKASWNYNEDESFCTISYLLKDDDIHNWKELIGTELSSKARNVLIDFYYTKFIEGYKSIYQDKIKYKIIKKSSNDILFEFQIKNTLSDDQNELQKAISTKDGLYVIRYAAKKADMGDTLRAKWTKIISNATVKN